MAEWIELVNSKYLNVDTMNAVYNDFIYINELLSEKGYTVYEITDNSVTYSISPADILSKMNGVESNIQTLENTVDWVNPYFKVFEWVKNTVNKKSEVNRWLLYLNFVHKVLTGEERAMCYLIDKNGNYIIDKFGAYILVYKEDNYE